jgi:hypothetical protein
MMIMMTMMMMTTTTDCARTHLYARKGKIHGLYLLTALPFLMYVMVIPKSDTSSYVDLPSLIVPTSHLTVSGIKIYIKIITNTNVTKCSVYMKYKKIKPYTYAVCLHCACFKRLSLGRDRIFGGLLATNCDGKYEI